MARILVGRVLDSSTDSVTVEPGSVPLSTREQNILVPVEYDTIVLVHGVDGPTLVTYKVGAATVATLTLGYSGGNLVSVVRS